MLYVFVITHLGGGGSSLCQNLVSLPNVARITNNNAYTHPLDWMKNNSSFRYANILIDNLVFNYTFANKALYKCCKFIYLMREAEPTLRHIVEYHPEYTPFRAMRYYCFRLRRMCEMAKNTPGAVLLDSEDVASGRYADVLKVYLGLKRDIPRKPSPFPETSVEIEPLLAAKAQERYNRHLAFMKNLPLLQAK